MLGGWVAILVYCAYVAALFALALWGERSRHRTRSGAGRRAIYVLGSCVYFSAWSFCGSIEMASHSGLDALAIYLGPILAFSFGHPLIARMVRLAKSQRITSVADFVAARYGKAASVAATITVIATLASVPFIALQIRAVAQSLAIFLDGHVPATGMPTASTHLTTILVTVSLAAFAIAIGTRHLDATEHQDGLMLAVAVESAIKLAAFLCVGIFVCWGIFRGIGDLTERVTRTPAIAAIIDRPPDPSLWLSLTLTSMATALFLPRQFHVSIVENRDERDVRAAAWFVPAYLAVSALFVMPIAVAGLATFPAGAIDRDFTILALPIHAKSAIVAMMALVGTVSAASSMVVVTTTTLAVMVSNDVAMPFLLRARAGLTNVPRAIPVLAMRRVAIGLIMALAFACTEAVAGHGFDLTSVALLSLAGVAQIVPAAIGGLVWRRGTARGAICGTLAGVAVLAYTLLVPTLVSHSSAIVTSGPLGIDALRPTDLFGLDLTPFAQALIWSLAINILAYAALSLSRPPSTNERLQANIFVGTKSMALATSFRLRHSTISTGELMAGVARYLRPQPAEQLLREWHAVRELPMDPSREADASLIVYAEHLIASSIGAASSHMVMSLLLQRQELSEAAARQIVDEAAFEIQDTRDLLQHAIDVARDGMAVFDSDLRLVIWNRAYREMFQLPQELMRVGRPLDELVRSNAERGVYGRGAPIDEFVGARLEILTRPTEGVRLYSAPYGRVLEMRSVRLTNGGLFFTYTDATAQVTSEEELEAENLTLERRVRERTEELEHLNVELLRAKAEAEDANVSKSRFLAAASHDLLQPLSAARLYTTSLRDRLRTLPPDDPTPMLAGNIDESLEAVEDILGALLEISRIDAGAIKTELTTFVVGDMLRQLQMEFEPSARERGLRLRFAPSSLRITSDRRLLRRMLQNLVSNAIKYTVEGSVVVGAKRWGDKVRIEIHDTGIGIPRGKQKIIFREFERLPAAAEASPGAGLGLSIVDRLGGVLKHEVGVRSKIGKGSVFSIVVPRAAKGAAVGALAGAATPRQRSLENLTVAAIDNEQHVLSAMTMLLQGWDCVVGCGTCLTEVERAFEGMKRGPDVIVADYHISDVDGLGVIAALRTRYGHRPAVLVTADRNPAIRDLAHAADVRVLHKPLKPAALRALLSQWLLVKVAAE